MKICYVIPPRRGDIIGARIDSYYGECILPEVHNGPHLILTPEGKYIKWEDDFDCDCCSVHEDDRCYIYKEISKKEAEELIKGCN